MRPRRRSTAIDSVVETPELRNGPPHALVFDEPTIGVADRHHRIGIEDPRHEALLVHTLVVDVLRVAGEGPSNPGQRGGSARDIGGGARKMGVQMLDAPLLQCHPELESLSHLPEGVLVTRGQDLPEPIPVSGGIALERCPLRGEALGEFGGATRSQLDDVSFQQADAAVESRLVGQRQ